MAAQTATLPLRPPSSFSEIRVREGTRRSFDYDDDEEGEEEGGEEEVGSRTGLTGRAITNANCTASPLPRRQGPPPEKQPDDLEGSPARGARTWRWRSS